MEHPKEHRQGEEGVSYKQSWATCTLDVFCRRLDSSAYVLREVRMALASRFEDRAALAEFMQYNYPVVSSDTQLFNELNRVYWRELCGPWRRHLALKRLRNLRILAVRTPIFSVLTIFPSFPPLSWTAL